MKMRTKATAFICIVFLAFSILGCLSGYKYVAIEKQGVNSSKLFLKTIKEDENVLRETYVDETGKTTFAVDKHYASVVKYWDRKGRVVSEFYFDEIGQPVYLSEGQAGVLREYDEDGREIKLTYVDSDGYPIRIKAGYVSILKEYDKNGNEIKDIYVDWMLNPIYRSEGYAGRKKEYDENGHCIRITNLNAKGEPMNTYTGVAMEERTLDVNGLVQTVMYFDVNGEPVANTLGQYGEAYSYDKQGRKHRITYLDAKGNAMLNLYGYAILQKTFKADNSTDTEMYFDSDGQPVKLSHGEYGIQRKNGRRYYLTKNGKVNYFLSLDDLLHANALLAILIGVVVCIMSGFLPKPFRIVLLLLYVGFILYMTLLYRADGNPKGQFELFWSYKEFFSDRSIRVELFQNIWLFVPLGALLYYSVQKQWVLVVPVLFSIIIETIQLFTGRGLFEFDDMISNGLGGCYGYLLGKLVSEMRNKMISLTRESDCIKHVENE